MAFSPLNAGSSYSDLMQRTVNRVCPLSVQVKSVRSQSPVTISSMGGVNSQPLLLRMQIDFHPHQKITLKTVPKGKGFAAFKIRPDIYACYDEVVR